MFDIFSLQNQIPHNLCPSEARVGMLVPILLSVDTNLPHDLSIR